MNKYLYLTGRVDLRQIEITIQNLLSVGMDPKTENNPYLGFIYTSFQERATKVHLILSLHFLMRLGLAWQHSRHGRSTWRCGFI